MVKALLIGTISLCVALFTVTGRTAEQRVSAFNIQGDPIVTIELYKTPRYMTTFIGIKPEEVKSYPHRHCVFYKQSDEFQILLSEISRTRYQNNYMDGEYRLQIDFKDNRGIIVHRLYSGPFYNNVNFVNAIWDGNHITIENRFLRWIEAYINDEANFCEDQGR